MRTSYMRFERILLITASLVAACSSGAVPGAPCMLDSDCAAGSVCFAMGSTGDVRRCMTSCDPASTVLCNDGSAPGYQPICLERALVGGGVCYTGGSAGSMCTDTRDCIVGSTCLTDRGACFPVCDLRAPVCVGDQMCIPIAGSTLRGYCELVLPDAGM